MTPATFSPPPTQRRMVEAIIEQLAYHHGSLPSGGRKPGRYLGSGGLVHFESIDPDGLEGLLEWASPECAGPAELAAVGRAQRLELKAAAAVVETQFRRHGFKGRILIFKNNVDAYGNGYGSHENYAVHEAPGKAVRGVWWGLMFGFWASIVTVNLPAILLSLLVLFVVLIVRMVGGLLAWTRMAVRPGRAMQAWVSGLGDRILDAFNNPGQGRFWVWVRRYEKLFFWPVLRVFSFPARRLLFRDLVGPLSSFLASRQVICGAGGLDGGFVISPRAAFLGEVLNLYMDVPKRPMIDAKAYLTFENLDFFRPVKRLHLMAGDANVGSYAEWLRLGTTHLVIRLLQSDTSIPEYRNPLAALLTISQDPDLEVAPKLRDGRPMTAVGHQREIFAACEAMVRAQGGSDEERELLTEWTRVLEGLAVGDAEVAGRVEWVRKRALMEEALVVTSSWAEVAAWLKPLRKGETALDDRVPEAVWTLKKIDAKFHEISSASDGYFERLEAAGLCRQAPGMELVDGLRTQAPRSTRARWRSRFIKRYRGHAGAKVSWDRLWTSDYHWLALHDVYGDENPGLDPGDEFDEIDEMDEYGEQEHDMDSEA
ncbi:proteasome accessory factor PafA2 family protein [bacterium AH-315-F18]|nr:proteasome accessory factor PafA2 family protein [bacterium AH-315-F18]